MPKILCFGDSITYGSWDQHGGWVARVRQKIDQICTISDLEKFYLTFNLGVSSDTSERTLIRFEEEVMARMIEEGDPYFIFSLGTNDSIWSKKDNKYWVDKASFVRNIRELIAKAKRYHSNIVFLGNLPVDESKTLPYRDDLDIQSSNNDIGEYEVVIKQVCDEERVDFIPVFNETLNEDYKKMLFNDGVHPNYGGHAYLAKKVWKFLESNGWIT